MDFSKLSYGQIEGIANQLNEKATQMESLLEEIKALFNKIGTDDVWNGTAASKTKEEFDRLSAKFPEFSSVISDCYKHLLSVVETYKSVDTKIIGE